MKKIIKRRHWLEFQVGIRRGIFMLVHGINNNKRGKVLAAPPAAVMFVHL